MTVEGERDDICGLGQTEAAHDLCPNIPVDEHYYYVQPGVGHYGVFSGTRWRSEIQPRIREMIRTIQFKRRVATGNSTEMKVAAALSQVRPAGEAVRLARDGRQGCCRGRRRDQRASLRLAQKFEHRKTAAPQGSGRFCCWGWVEPPGSFIRAGGVPGEFDAGSGFAFRPRYQPELEP